MKLRKAELKDEKSIYQLMCQLENCLFEESRFHEIYQLTLAHSDHELYVAESEEVVGMIHLRYELQLHHNDWVCELMECVVDETCRSIGIGEKLIKYAQQRVLERNIQAIELTSGVQRTRAHAFYEKQGFKKTHVKMVWREE